jgi:hypothetical protein
MSIPQRDARPSRLLIFDRMSYSEIVSPGRFDRCRRDMSIDDKGISSSICRSDSWIEAERAQERERHDPIERPSGQLSGVFAFSPGQ